MTTRVTDRVSQHNITPARSRPRPQRTRTRPIFWSQTGLDGLRVRPTVSDHITDKNWPNKIKRCASIVQDKERLAFASTLLLKSGAWLIPL